MRNKIIRRLSWLSAALLFLNGCQPGANESKELILGTFGAFYTKIDTGGEFERYSRTGEYADIVVDLGTGNTKLVFGRGSSYLPYLETNTGKWYVEEVIPRNGNGEGIMPDRINTYSHVKIIETNPDKVVVHWRYLPEFSGLNPHSGVDARKFVDEYFSITPDGKVKRTIRQGTEKIDQWKDPKNRITQTFTLTEDGIADLATSGPGSSEALGPVEGNPLITGTVVDPVAWWKLDEAEGGLATEAVSGTQSEIQGHKSLWKKGISGTSLQFDGYHSLITLQEEKCPAITDGLTLEAWIAIGAYPWNWTPVVQQGDDEGYYLGINGHGHPGFKLMVGDVWEELVSEVFLERNRWYHLAGTYDMETGTMKIYVDGQEAGSKTVGKERIGVATAEIKIGKGKEMRPTDPVRENTFIDSYGFDGLIDEVRIYDTGLSARQVAQSFTLFGSALVLKDRPDMEARSLPVLEPGGEFGAYYTRLRFYETWDNLWRFSGHPDVVVSFDELPTHFVFWRGTCYIPMMVNEEGQWYSNEFNETWGTSGGQGCQEPMSDKESYTNHARIIENTDARVVVHWRYPLLDVLHVYANVDEVTGWGDWSDWYYYIYPDGVAVKKMHLWTHGERNHEWQESMAIFGPNQHPEEIIETSVALTMVDMEGNATEYSWEGGPPDNVDQPEDKVIQHVNYRAVYDPVTIGEFEESDVYGGELTPYAVFPTWNHWPVAQMPSDGRYASFPDRTAHSSLTHVGLPTYDEDFGDRPFQQKIIMEAMLDKEPLELLPLAASWLNPPDVKTIKGCESDGYDRTQRAFLVDAVEEDMSLKVEASEDRPIVNPCFVIRNWARQSPASLAVNGKWMTSGPDVRQGIIRDTGGTWTMVVWFRLEATKPVEFVFESNTVGNNQGL
ncbi:MAG: LamG domain-containing protein [Bacteroidales bacterium]